MYYSNIPQLLLPATVCDIEINYGTPCDHGAACSGGGSSENCEHGET